MLHAPDGYYWVGRRLLSDEETWDDRGRLIHNQCSNIRDFRTIRKARNVLWSIPKGKGAMLYREYTCRKNGKLLTDTSSGYEFNSTEDVEAFDAHNGYVGGEDGCN